MLVPKNKKKYSKYFTYRLTHWMKADELDSFAQPFGNTYGKCYCIKKKSDDKLYAIYVRRDSAISE